MADEKKLKLDIVTPEATSYSGDRVALVSLPASLGRVGILPGHMPLVSTLENGEIHVLEAGGNRIEMQAGTGFLQVKENQVIVLIESTTSKVSPL